MIPGQETRPGNFPKGFSLFIFLGLAVAILGATTVSASLSDSGFIDEKGKWAGYILLIGGGGVAVGSFILGLLNTPEVPNGDND